MFAESSGPPSCRGRWGTQFPPGHQTEAIHEPPTTGPTLTQPSRHEQLSTGSTSHHTGLATGGECGPGRGVPVPYRCRGRLRRAGDPNARPALACPCRTFLVPISPIGIEIGAAILSPAARRDDRCGGKAKPRALSRSGRGSQPRSHGASHAETVDGTRRPRAADSRRRG